MQYITYKNTVYTHICSIIYMLYRLALVTMFFKLITTLIFLIYGFKLLLTSYDLIITLHLKLCRFVKFNVINRLDAQL